MNKTKYGSLSLAALFLFTGCGDKTKEVTILKKTLNEKYDSLVKEARLLGDDFIGDNEKYKRFKETFINNNNLSEKLEKETKNELQCVYYLIDDEWRILKKTKKLSKNDCADIFKKEYENLEKKMTDIGKEMETFREDTLNSYHSFLEEQVNIIEDELKVKYEKIKNIKIKSDDLVSSIIKPALIKSFEALYDAKIFENSSAILEKIKNKDVLYINFKEAKFSKNPFSSKTWDFGRLSIIKKQWNDTIKFLKDNIKKLEPLIGK